MFFKRMAVTSTSEHSIEEKRKQHTVRRTGRAVFRLMAKLVPHVAWGVCVWGARGLVVVQD